MDRRESEGDTSTTRTMTATHDRRLEVEDAGHGVWSVIERISPGGLDPHSVWSYSRIRLSLHEIAALNEIAVVPGKIRKKISLRRKIDTAMILGGTAAYLFTCYTIHPMVMLGTAGALLSLYGIYRAATR